MGTYRSQGGSGKRELADGLGRLRRGLHQQVRACRCHTLVVIAVLTLGAQTSANQADSWQAAVLEAQAQAASLDPGSDAFTAAAEELSVRAEREFPMQWDWCLQDAGPDFGRWLSASAASATARQAADKAIAELGADGSDLRNDFDHLVSQSAPAESRQWIELYLRAAGLRREMRLRNLHRHYPQWVFTKHCILGGSHYAYTEGQSDAQHERQFEPGAALCRLEIEGDRCAVRTLIDDPNGVIRDPDVSWDGRHVLFAWKKSDRQDDYHLYEMEVATGSIRQLTHGLGFADYEGVYLPNDDIVFNSTRCVQTVDCWWTEVSNLYTCDRDGRYLRRLAFDQVHDNFPTVMPDGRVIYTRWEYSDRGQLFVQGLFQMNPDGTGQTEFYGNNSWFPTSLLHARGIPGTQKVVATFSGHHTLQVGKLGIVDPARGRQENSGARLIAPVRETPADRIDYYGQDGELFQYPYPLSESEFVIACAPLGWSRNPTRFKLYWIAADGRRELLAADPDVPCNQAVPLVARPRPLVRPSLVDYTKTTGTCYLQDIYAGPGLEGVTRGTIQKLRVIALDYRAAGMGWNYNAGPAGDALVCTPAAIGNGSWDVKTVLGDATVHPDGSAFFNLPARTPVYFQAIDARGYAAQTMRSWLTVQPGENVSCLGCHELKNSTLPAQARPSKAFAAGPQDLAPFQGPPRGFSFSREIQPILDRSCVRCHNDARKLEERLGHVVTIPPCPAVASEADNETAFSLCSTAVTESLAKRRWSAGYLALVQATQKTLEGHLYLAGTSNALVNWISAQSVPDMLPAYSAGAARSRLLSLLADGHYDAQVTPEEIERIACWIDLQVPFCGDYQEASQWTAEEQQRYEHFLAKRRRMEELERRNIAALLEAYSLKTQAAAPAPGGDNGTGLSPSVLAVNAATEELYVAATGGRQILVIDRTTCLVHRRIDLPEVPSGVAISANGVSLYVTAGVPDGTVLVIDSQTGAARARIPAGHSPTAPVLSTDGGTLLVCDRFRSRLLAIDLAAQTIRGELPVGREPVAAALTPDGRRVLVANLLPAGPATSPRVAAEVVAVNAADLTLVGRIGLPNGSTSVRGICVSPDGAHAYVVHTLAHHQLPTTQVDRGWMNASALSIIDIPSWRRIATVLLDDVDRGAANPWDVVCTGDGRWLCVSHSGTHEVSIIDRLALHRKLDRVAAGPEDVASDLSFLVDLRRRVRLPGKGPRDIAVVGQTLYVAEYFSDSVATVDLGADFADTLVSIPLGPTAGTTDVQRGEMFFHDADLCFQGWQSCASCHPDARTDGLNWDLLNDGPGTPRNTKSMLRSHRTPPAMSVGVRETAEAAVRAGLHHIQFVASGEANASAIDAYLKSIEPLPSPYAADQDLIAKAQRGKGVFEKAGCQECHPAPLYTSLAPYDVGTSNYSPPPGRTGEAFDTPTLVELWRTAPYLHDGRAATLEEVLTKFNPEDRHGKTSNLSETEIDDLTAFLLSL
ncbi:MAG: hypothetical protein GXY19_00940 [Phycisphaerae bacterium]|nr:hypothetical protein [Phycisphaerae bacterium]